MSFINGRFGGQLTASFAETTGAVVVEYLDRSSVAALTIDWVTLLDPFERGAPINSWYNLSNLNVE
jgi:hypothetical protein